MKTRAAIVAKMARSALVAILGGAIAVSCAPSRPARPAPLPVASSGAPCARCDAALAAYIGASPAKGRLLGNHEYDGRIADYSRIGIERRIAASKRDLAALDALAHDGLSPDAALDRDMLRGSFREEIFDLEDRALWRTDPSYYTELFSVNDYADREGAPVAVRLDRLLRHEEEALRRVPHVYENLRLPLSKPVAEAAANRFAGYADYLRNTVPSRMLAGADAPTRARFEKTNSALAAEATRLAEWLRRDVVPHGDDSHVLGRERFEKLVALYAGTVVAGRTA